MAAIGSPAAARVKHGRRQDSSEGVSHPAGATYSGSGPTLTVTLVRLAKATNAFCTASNVTAR